MRWGRSLLFILACSHPASAPHPPLAGSASASAPDYRAFVAPPALVSPGPATVPAKKCNNNASGVTDHEHARERAALDAELRKTGAMLLETHIDRRTRKAAGIGSFRAGPAGERWLVVGRTNACAESFQTVAIDASGEVFGVTPQATPSKTTNVTVCLPDCRGGCGEESDREAVLVEVPAGAHLGGARTVSFPIDVQVTTQLARGVEECEPKP